MNNNDFTLSPSQRNIVKTWWKKVTLNNPQMKQRRFIEGGVFGVPLTESIHYAYSKISWVDKKSLNYTFIPIVVAKCGSFLKEKGIFEEGVFRISGNAKRLTALQTLFDTPGEYGLDIDWTGYTVHDVANTMSRYLTHLPQPLITLEYQTSFKNIIELDFSSLESKIYAFQKLIGKLPNVHQHLLLYILDLLYMFSVYSEHTRMDLSNLATTFAPAIFSDPQGVFNPIDYKKSQQILEFLIQYQEHFVIASDATLISDMSFPYSQSTVNLSFLKNTSLPNVSSLKRSNTAPSKRSSGLQRPDTVSTRNAVRWKSIKKISKEKNEKV